MCQAKNRFHFTSFICLSYPTILYIWCRIVSSVHSTWVVHHAAIFHFLFIFAMYAWDPSSTTTMIIAWHEFIYFGFVHTHTRQASSARTKLRRKKWKDTKNIYIVLFIYGFLHLIFFPFHSYFVHCDSIFLQLNTEIFLLIFFFVTDFIIPILCAIPIQISSVVFSFQGNAMLSSSASNLRVFIQIHLAAFIFFSIFMAEQYRQICIINYNSKFKVTIN